MIDATGRSFGAPSLVTGKRLMTACQPASIRC